MNEIKIPKSWDEVDVKCYLKYLDYVKEMNDAMAEADKLKEAGKINEANGIYLDYLPFKVSIDTISILGGIDPEDLESVTMDRLNELAKDIDFIYDVNKVKVRKDFINDIIKDSNGNEFGFIPLDDRSVREAKQMEAFEYMYVNDSVQRIGWKFAVILRKFERVVDPVTGKEIRKWDSYDFGRLEHYKDIILSQKVGDIIGLNDFFLSIHQGLLNPILKSSQSKKNQKDLQV